jgi:hypothetical protein
MPKWVLGVETLTSPTKLKLYYKLKNTYLQVFFSVFNAFIFTN